MNNNKRLIKNSLFLYFRMLFLMAIGFYTTRVVLEALGVVDLGIFNVVGSLVVMFDFVSSGLTNSTQRCLNLGLANNDAKLTRKYFSHSFLIHLLMALTIAVFAETIGLWFVYNKLNIPIERFTAALVIYHFSVLSLVFRLIKTCYESDVIARENMSMYAYLSIVEGVGKLLICFVVIYDKSWDKLILYGFLILCLNFSILIFNVQYCMRRYAESFLLFEFDKKTIKQLSSFIGVNSVGVLFWSLGKQGLNIILNIFFGPVVNGAKGLATTVDGVLTRFGSSVDVAVRPQLTKYYAQGNLDEMVSLAEKATKYIVYILLVVSIPFVFQTDIILRIWLKTVPDYTKVFVQLLIVEMIANALGSSYNTISMATGNIKNVQIYGRIITLSTLPLSYICCMFWKNPYLPVVLMSVLTLLYSFYIVYDVNRQISFGFNRYLKKVLFPIFKTIIVSLLVSWLLCCLIKVQSDILDFVIKTMATCFVTISAACLLGLDKNERCFIMNKVKSLYKKHTTGI